MLLHPIRIITPVPDVGPSGSVINSNYFSVFAVKACIFPKNIVPLQQIFLLYDATLSELQGKYGFACCT